MDVPTKRLRKEPDNDGQSSKRDGDAKSLAYAQPPTELRRKQNNSNTPANQNKYHMKNQKKRKKSKAGFVKGDPTWNGCMLWMQRKNRYCKFPRFKGCLYCTHHAGQAGDGTGHGAGAGKGGPATANANAPKIRKRVPCPHDPRHDVYEHRLQQHLKKCPMFVQISAGKAMPYYRKDCNTCETMEAIASKFQAATSNGNGGGEGDPD